ncbi:sugar porter family MFS transporter [Pontiella sulfatireligans]|uniref:D-xylose-proton symporter n=1 Tax=Pontiella sulfatireligans TaxID=2750658 RepID=A0A6C2UPV2_9BACT|nr:sugar porter family MFS transporter [Pontiella sulfatireligans]VGO22305.1 D-xylose-proton symporter [Pontiella sulfatireligans]
MSETKHKTGFVILIAMVATIGGFLFGFDSGVINGTVDGLTTAFSLTSQEVGSNVASMLLGCAAGAFAAGRLADRFGRKSILLVSAIFFSVSAWGSGIATGSTEFIIYRIVGGLAVGAASVLAPAYISEVAPAKYRGMLSSLQQVAIISGLFIAFLSNYLIAGSAEAAAIANLPAGADISAIKGSTSVFAMGYDAWRWMFWVELVPAVIFFFALLIIPESPRYLVAVGKKEQAMDALTKLMGDSAEHKYNEIEGTLSSDHHKPRFRDILGKFGFRPVVWIGIGLAALQQFVGINVVFYYGSVMWQAAGFGESDALLINVIGGALSIGAVVVGILVIDRIGRKPMLLIGSIGMTITLAAVAIIFSQAGSNEAGDLMLTKSTGLAALIAANLYVVFFNFSWGPVMWVMLGEMFPNQIRGSALAVAGLVQWVANYAITKTFPMMLGNESIGLGGAYSMYAIFAAISTFFVIKFVYETKGLELEEMQG